MATEKVAESTPSKDLTTIAEVLHRLVDRTEAGPVPQVRIANAKFKTPWNPTGTQDRPSLSRTTFLNGHRLREITLSDEEITLFNKLKPGRYHNRKWLVVEADSENGSSIQVFIPNKTEADRLETKAAASNLAGILRIMTSDAPSARAAE